MLPKTQSPSVQEVATATTTISSPSLIPSPSSSAAAATAQKQQLQSLNVTHSVISNSVVTGTDASFVGYKYTTPTGATEGVLSVRSPSVSKPQTRPESDSELEAGESKSGAIPIGKTMAQVMVGQDTVTAILITPRAHDADFAQREKKEEEEEEEEEEKEAEEAAKKSKIRRQTAASYFVCAKWLREQMEDSG
ncbi:hypothetical protein B0T13DRAFT_505893 [Neurospora crassa]|nr:hypothetical protein B0T13DRAFT_505893 [Neurospora crassa]